MNFSHVQSSAVLVLSAILAVFPVTATARETGGVVFIKGGVMHLQDDSQMFEGAGGPVNVDINTRSAYALNIGWELRLPRDWAVGTEYLAQRHRFTPSGSTSFGTAETDVFMVTGKKYFLNINKGVVRPYIGGGIGAEFNHVANTRTGGTIDNYDFAFLAHALLGVELRIEHLSVMIEIRDLEYTVNHQKADFDPSGASVLLGAGVNW